MTINQNSLGFLFFYIFLHSFVLCACVNGCGCTYDMARGTYVEVTGQLWGVNSFLLPRGSWRSNSVLRLGDRSPPPLILEGNFSPPPPLLSLLHLENQYVSYRISCQAGPSTRSGAWEPELSSNSSVTTSCEVCGALHRAGRQSVWSQPQSGVLLKWGCMWLPTRHARKLARTPVNIS